MQASAPVPIAVATVVFSVAAVTILPRSSDRSRVGDVLAGATGSTRQEPSVVAVFDPDAGELPSGLAVGQVRNLYVGMARTGEIKKLTPDGAVSTFARLPDAAPGVLSGLAFYGSCLFALVASTNPETHGIWCFMPDGSLGGPPFAPLDQTGRPHAITTAAGPFPLVSDSALGRISSLRLEAITPARGSVLERGAQVTFTVDVSYTLAAGPGRIVGPFCSNPGAQTVRG